MKKASFIFLFPLLAFAQQQTQLPQHPVPARPLVSSAGEKCLQGGKNALLAAAILTGIGCAFDLFMSGGALCVTTYIPTAVANAPTAAAAGCAVGSIDSPSAGASAGVSAANVHIQF